MEAAEQWVSFMYRVAFGHINGIELARSELATIMTTNPKVTVDDVRRELLAVPFRDARPGGDDGVLDSGLRALPENGEATTLSTGHWPFLVRLATRLETVPTSHRPKVAALLAAALTWLNVPPGTWYSTDALAAAERVINQEAVLASRRTAPQGQL